MVHGEDAVERVTGSTHVRQVRQLRQALMRVARAVPSGAMRSVKARLMEATVVGVILARRAM